MKIKAEELKCGDIFYSNGAKFINIGKVVSHCA